jgi:hypothetical protein
VPGRVRAIPGPIWAKKSSQFIQTPVVAPFCNPDLGWAYTGATSPVEGGTGGFLCILGIIHIDTVWGRIVSRLYRNLDNLALFSPGLWHIGLGVVA